MIFVGLDGLCFYGYKFLLLLHFSIYQVFECYTAFCFFQMRTLLETSRQTFTDLSSDFNNYTADVTF